MASRISLTTEHSHHATQFPRLITGHEQKVYADKAYDSRSKFNLLRKNFSTLSRASPLRGKTATEIKKLGEDQWKNIHEYGKRRTVGIYFSGLKRTMGEVIKAKRTDYIAQEIALKVQFYNEMRQMTHAY